MNPSMETVTAEGVNGILVSLGATEAVVDYQKHSTAIAETLYLIHAARESSSRTAAPGRYWVKVWLDTYTETEFNACTRLTYRLHESFKHPIVATEAKEKHFELWMEICEEFTVVAYVEREAKDPLWLTCFIELPQGAGV
ncbi:pYEATS domain-containing protein [Leptothermofonsia sp. ETS-13]|uniref:pYEATS domain-containing protein n=1 Tax=Leptothermofonsia sp. ETS-13 TaxID=3035696 RepID=UPI003BA0DF62